VNWKLRSQSTPFSQQARDRWQRLGPIECRRVNRVFCGMRSAGGERAFSLFVLMFVQHGGMECTSCDENCRQIVATTLQTYKKTSLSSQLLPAMLTMILINFGEASPSLQLHCDHLLIVVYHSLHLEMRSSPPPCHVHNLIEAPLGGISCRKTSAP
jgi:hypothetical protein